MGTVYVSDERYAVSSVKVCSVCCADVDGTSEERCIVECKPDKEVIRVLLGDADGDAPLSEYTGPVSDSVSWKVSVSESPSPISS